MSEPKPKPPTLSQQVGQALDLLVKMDSRISALESKPAAPAPQAPGIPGLSAPEGTKIAWDTGSGMTKPDGTPLPRASAYATTGKLKRIPVPEDFEAAKNQILDPSFTLVLDHFTDRPESLLTVIVPDSHSNTPVSERNMALRNESGKLVDRQGNELPTGEKPIMIDLRTKRISDADGINGAVAFFEAIRGNLVANKTSGAALPTNR